MTHGINADNIQYEGFPGLSHSLAVLFVAIWKKHGLAVELMMRSTCEYQTAMQKYKKGVLVAGMIAFGVFIAALWAVAELLSRFRAQGLIARNLAKSSVLLQIIILFGIITLCSAPTLAILYFAVRRARVKSDLRCVTCGGELFSEDSHYHIRLLATCPHCGSQVIEGTPRSIDPGYFDRSIQETYRHLRFAIVAVITSCPVMYAILVWGKLNSTSSNSSWFVILGFPVCFASVFLGFFYILVSASLAKLNRVKNAWQGTVDVKKDNQGT